MVGVDDESVAKMSGGGVDVEPSLLGGVELVVGWEPSLDGEAKGSAWRRSTWSASAWVVDLRRQQLDDG